jgi:hypothetical protein
MKSERNGRNLAIGPNGASCRWRDLRATLQAHQVGIPGRYRSLAGDGEDAPISEGLTGTHSESARGMNLMPGR